MLIALEIIPDGKYIKDNGFDMFNKEGVKYKLSSDRYGKATPDKVEYIGNCYTFYNSNRNQLSHWDAPMTPLDTTKLLDVNGAHDLIIRNYICEYLKSDEEVLVYSGLTTSQQRSIIKGCVI